MNRIFESRLRCVACQHRDSHPRQFCRGNFQFSLKSWRQLPMQLPKPWSNVRLCNPSVKLKIQRNTAPSLEDQIIITAQPLGSMEAMQHSPSETPGADPGWGMPALSGGAGRRGERITCFTVSQDYWSCSSCLNWFHLSDYWCYFIFVFPFGTFRHMEKLMMMMKLSQ